MVINYNEWLLNPYKIICKCGCNNEIIIRKYHKWYGIPEYIHNHHNKGKHFSEEIKERMRKCKNKGRFIRKHNIWSLDNFNDGYIDSDGRFRVYYPNHVRSYNEGYILRSIIAYEIYNNDIVNMDEDVHHIDKNRLNDSKENLIKIKHKKHKTTFHKEDINEIRICENCGKEFKIKRWKKTKYCSHKCYNSKPKSKETKDKVSNSLKLAYEEGKHERRI